MMTRCLPIVLTGLLSIQLSGMHAFGSDRFPGQAWEKAGSPGALGWSSAKLKEAWAYADTIDTATVVIVQDGMVVDEWGETSRPFRCHSMRKSILSALYGIHVAAGRIDLDRTMEDVGINDNEPSLSETEKQATIRMLLQARSGIYHPALYETKRMKARKPKRHSHPPGTFWYYNNWDFNASGTIFENLTGRGIFEEFEDKFAKPLQMQDFRRETHTRYVTGSDSVHPAYPFVLSARDLARLGLLWVRGGRWKEQRIALESWVAESTKAYSDAGRSGGYGYMWWVAANGKHLPHAKIPDGSYSARGHRGHHVLVIPRWDLVIVHRVNTFTRDDRVSSEQFGQLVEKILQAKPDDLK